MEAEGSLKFEKFDPEMVVPEDIEEKLGKGVSMYNLPPSASMTAADQPQGAPAAATPGGASIPSNIAEELTTLRRKLVHLTQENHRLQQDNQVMKEKLDQIKKIA
jgi:hypothetical protein